MVLILRFEVLRSIEPIEGSACNQRISRVKARRTLFNELLSKDGGTTAASRGGCSTEIITARRAESPRLTTWFEARSRIGAFTIPDEFASQYRGEEEQPGPRTANNESGIIWVVTVAGRGLAIAGSNPYSGRMTSADRKLFLRGRYIG